MIEHLKHPDDDDFGQLSDNPRRREMYRNNIHLLAVERCGLGMEVEDEDEADRELKQAA